MTQKIIDTLEVNEKNTVERIINGESKLVMSIKLFPFDIYVGGIWLPKNVNFGDVVDIYIDQVEATEKNGNTYYNAKFAKASKNFFLSDKQPSMPMASDDDVADLFGGSEPMTIADDDMPF